MERVITKIRRDDSLGRPKSENSKTKQIQFRATEDEMIFLKLIADEKNTSISDVIRRGLGLVRKEMALDGELEKVLEKL